MRSSLVVRASRCQCTSCNGPGFDPSICRHSGIWGVADEAVLIIVRKKNYWNSGVESLMPLIRHYICLKVGYRKGEGGGGSTAIRSIAQDNYTANRPVSRGERGVQNTANIITISCAHIFNFVVVPSSILYFSLCFLCLFHFLHRFCGGSGFYINMVIWYKID